MSLLIGVYTTSVFIKKTYVYKTGVLPFSSSDETKSLKGLIVSDQYFDIVLELFGDKTPVFALSSWHSFDNLLSPAEKTIINGGI